jgi:hypothetical protein
VADTNFRFGTTHRGVPGTEPCGAWSELLASPFADWPAVLAACGATAEPWREAALRGGLPVPASRLAAEDRTVWFSGYVQTYPERDLQARRPEVLYWRAATGLEVDFIMETPGRLLPVEVKASACLCVLLALFRLPRHGVRELKPEIRSLPSEPLAPRNATSPARTAGRRTPGNESR